VSTFVSGHESADVSTMPQHITCLLSERGLLWIGTSTGFILTISLPRLEGVPQVRGRPTVSYHAQSGPVRFLFAVQCNMVAAAGRSADPTSTPVTEDTPVKNLGSAFTDNELMLGSLQKQPSWVSSPDLSFANDPDPDADGGGSVSDLYGSLLKGMDADFDSELTSSSGGAFLRHHNHRIHPSTINTVSSRVMNRLSNVISKGRADVRACFKPQPLPKDFRSETLSSTTDATDQTPAFSEVCDQPLQGSSHESLDSSSLAESVSLDSAGEVFERGSAVNASYRRMVVPKCPSMVLSNLVHVQSSKALIVVSGGTGYRCWSSNKSSDAPPTEDSCLLLWKC